MTNAHADKREFCPAVNDRTGWRCDFAAHPWQTHWTWVEGELKVWSAPTPTWTNVSGTEDPLRDAPERLRDIREETCADRTEKQRRALYEAKP